jgi:bifunctional non-homologous end joining protein LigD
MSVTSTTLNVDGHAIELSNSDKVLFPQSGITKRDLVQYYRSVAAVALPHYTDRPVSMQRFPDGIDAEGFFQKQVADYFPKWIDRVELAKEDGTITYAVVSNAATLVWLANQAAITFHLALSRRDRPAHPDRLIFDLDPPGHDFTVVQAAARHLKALLDELELSSYVQTTGSRGMHIVIPLDRSSDFETVRTFARNVAEHLANDHPDTLTIEQRKAKRGARVFIDYLRNAYGQTAVAPYTVRPLEGAPVATPLDWGEAGASGLDARRYHIGNVMKRLGQRADPWADIERRCHSLPGATERLRALRG